MPRRLHIPLFAIIVALSAVLLVISNARPRLVAAYNCGPTNSPTETNSKLQIFVSGPRSNEVTWAFTVSPNPFTLGAPLHVTDNQSPDLNSGRADMLLEDVCTSVANETYTVAVDPTVNPPCPLVQSTLTRTAPAPTPPGTDPATTAFYFITVCPTVTPTPLPTLTPTPTPTATPPFIPPPFPPPPTPTPPPGFKALIVNVDPSDIPCQSSATVVVTARQGFAPVQDGTAVQVSVGYGLNLTITLYL